MEGNPSSLAALELYVKELFSGNANNQQIHKIHQALENFSRQKGAWKDALYFLNQTLCQQTAMYSLTVLEGFITKGWSGLSSEEQLELRSTLHHWLLEKHQFTPYFIRNKAVQLMVHIARTEWPEKYPEFYNNVLMLVSSPDTSLTILGLLFLQTTSEELGTPRDDLLSSRKCELKQNLLQLVPQTLSILTGLLQNIWEKHAHTITSTPPPSPTNSLPPSNSNCHSVSGTTSSSLALHCELEPVARLALQCLTHFFSWIPLSSHVTPQLMELVFRFVSMGTEQPLPQIHTSKETCVSVVALGTINEVLYKNCVPAEFENFVVLLFNNSCIILHHLVHNFTNDHLPQQTRPQFVEKLVELVHLLISSHLRRLEGRQLPQFSVPQFLSLFFSFTFEQTDWCRYTSCLDTWQVFLSHVKQNSENQPDSNGYRDSLVTLSQRVLAKILFSSNAAQLEELDNEATDGNLETEREKIFRQSIEIFVTTGELVKNQTLMQLNEPFQRCTSAYQSLAAMSAAQNGVIRIESKAQFKEMTILFKDLSTLLQLVGRLCELHTGSEYPNHFEVGKSLVQSLLDLAACGTVVAGIKFTGSLDDDLVPLLAQIHAQCLSSLHAWCHWISILAHANGPKDHVDSLVAALVTSASGAFSPVWSSSATFEQNHEKVYYSGLQLLSSIVNVIRTPALWQCPAWVQLYQSAYDINHLPPKIHHNLVCCVLSSTIVTWRNCNSEEQHWDQRTQRLQVVVDRATQTTRVMVEQLSRENHTSLLLQGKPTVLSTLSMLSDLAGQVRDETTPSKVALHSVIGPWIEPTLILLSYYCAQDHEVTEAIFHFYLVVFDSLLTQVGIAKAEKAVQTFLQTFNQHNIQLTLQHDNVYGIRAVEQLLKILQIVVQEPGAAFKRFLSSTLTLCLDHIYPCIAQVPSSDLKETFYQLLTFVLRHHWRSFFKGSVLATYGSRELDRTEQVENKQQFLAILSAYGQSFLLPDVSIFKQNLEALESLQSKWKLYHKAIFREGIADQFITTLLDVLTNGSHELLREEICLAIYAMASPNFEAFCKQLLPSYLLNCQGIEDQQRLLLKTGFSNDTDLPSFTQNLHRLTNDLRCLRASNVSNLSLYQS